MLSTRSAAVAAALSSALLAATLVAQPAHADPLTCQGRAVTLSGDTGTDGDDVMVVGGPGHGRSVDTRAGDDVVCIRVTTAGQPWSIHVTTGPGDDRVVNETTESGVEVGTALGTGADSYVGNDLAEWVTTGAAAWSDVGDTSDDAVDVVETRGGNDYVTSGSVATGAANDDVVATGGGDDWVQWGGEQASGRLDLGAGANAMSLYPGWQGTSVLVDAAARTVTADQRAVLTWTGDVTTWSLSLDNSHTTFTGADLAENLLYTQDATVTAGRRLDIAMGGGADRLTLFDFVPGSAVGGPGRDRFYAPQCVEAVARLGTTFHCRSYGPSTVEGDSTIDAWEYLHTTGDDITAIGTDGPDTIVAAGAGVRVEGRGGDDDLRVSGWGGGGRGRPVEAGGGAGDDRIRGGYSDDRLAGGPGRDDLSGRPGSDLLLGGAGSDRLRGGRDADRLVGGRGRDRGDGGKDRDRCSAEVRRSCERR